MVPYGMQIETIHRKMQDRKLNLSDLARRTGINIRTLRRIKSGETKKIHHSTAVLLEKELRK